MSEEQLKALYFVDRGLVERARAAATQKNQGRFAAALAKYISHVGFANLYLQTHNIHKIGEHLRVADEMKQVLENIAGEQ